MSESANVNIQKSGLSTASMVLGIIAICLCFIPFLNYISIILGILSIIFGLIGIIKKAEREKAVAGLILGIISVIIAYNMYFVVGKTLETVGDNINNAMGISSSNNTKSDKTKIISLGETFSGKDVEINIESAQFSQNVEPPVKNMFYTHYQVDDSSNIYLYVILNCKNISNNDLTASFVADVIAKYNNYYTYSSFSTVPNNTTGFNYSSITNIKPLTSQKIYYLMEMPKSIADETDTPIEINIKVDDMTYIYKYR